MATVADRNNNPGNLRDSSTGGFRQFNSPQEGYAALLNDLQAKKTGTTTTGVGPSSTLADFAKVYAPPTENNSAQYAANLANYMGVRPDAKLSELDVGKWADAVSHAEGYSGAPAPSSHPTQTQPPAAQTPPQPAQSGDLLDKATNVVNAIFPGKQVGEAIGTLGGYLLSPHKDQYDLSAPTPLQTAGDVAQGALTVGAGLPEAAGLKVFGKTIPAVKAAGSALGRIGQTAALGAGIGASGALAQGSTDTGDITKQALTGGAIGGALGGVGELVNKAAQFLPQRVVRSFIPGTNKETAQYAADRGLGSPQKMYNDSTRSLTQLGKQLDSSLNDPKYADIVASPDQIFQGAIQQFPNAGLTQDEIIKQLYKLAPLQKNLIDKLAEAGTEEPGTIQMAQRGLTLPELNKLKSAIGEATYKSVFDDPQVRAGKQVGNAVYQSIKKFITDAAPETQPVFDDFTKEIQLNGALRKALRSKEKVKFFTLRDLVALMAGAAAGGLEGAALGYAGEKILTSPTANLTAAGLVGKLPSIGKGLVAPAIRGGTNLSQ